MSYSVIDRNVFYVYLFLFQYLFCFSFVRSDIPTVGSYIQKPFKIALEKQKEKLHRKPGQGASTTSVSEGYDEFV